MSGCLLVFCISTRADQVHHRYTTITQSDGSRVTSAVPLANNNGGGSKTSMCPFWKNAACLADSIFTPADTSAIVGGVVGGVVGLALLAGLLFFCFRKRRNSKDDFDEMMVGRSCGTPWAMTHTACSTVRSLAWRSPCGSRDSRPRRLWRPRG